MISPFFLHPLGRPGVRHPFHSALNLATHATHAARPGPRSLVGGRGGADHLGDGRLGLPGGCHDDPPGAQLVLHLRRHMRTIGAGVGAVEVGGAAAFCW